MSTAEEQAEQFQDWAKKNSMFGITTKPHAKYCAWRGATSSCAVVKYCPSGTRFAFSAGERVSVVDAKTMKLIHSFDFTRSSTYTSHALAWSSSSSSSSTISIISSPATSAASSSSSSSGSSFPEHAAKFLCFQLSNDMTSASQSPFKLSESSTTDDKTSCIVIVESQNWTQVGRLIVQFQNAAMSLEFFKQDTRLLVAGASHSAYIYEVPSPLDTEAPRLLHSLSLGHSAFESAIYESNEITKIFLVGYSKSCTVFQQPEGGASEFTKGEPIETAYPKSAGKQRSSYSGNIFAIAISPNNQLVALGQSDGPCVVFNARTHEVLHIFGCSDDEEEDGDSSCSNYNAFGPINTSISALSFSPDSCFLAVAKRDGRLYVFSVFKLLSLVENPHQNVSSCRSSICPLTSIMMFRTKCELYAIAFSPRDGGKTLLAGGDGDLGGKSKTYETPKPPATFKSEAEAMIERDKILSERKQREENGKAVGDEEASIVEEDEFGCLRRRKNASDTLADAELDEDQFDIDSVIVHDWKGEEEEEEKSSVFVNTSSSSSSSSSSPRKHWMHVKPGVIIRAFTNPSFDLKFRCRKPCLLMREGKSSGVLARAMQDVYNVFVLSALYLPLVPNADS